MSMNLHFGTLFDWKRRRGAQARVRQFHGGLAASLALAIVLITATTPTVVRAQYPSGAAASVASADGTEWPQWTSGRYRLSPGDVVQLVFPFVPDFDQTLTVQPDGYVSPRGISDVLAQGLTVPQFHAALVEAYGPVLREPTVTVVLKEFEKPFFIMAGEVSRPGKYDLRSATTVTQALAIAGGMTRAAKSSQVIVFRRFTSELLEVKALNASRMLAQRDLSEDAVLRPGDTVFVPRRTLANLAPFIPQPSLSFFLNPLGAIQ